MFVIILLMSGVCLGLTAGRLSTSLKLDERMLCLAVYLALFIIAVSTGLDEKIVRSLDSIGWITFIIIVGAVLLGSAIFSFLYKNLFGKVYKV